MKIQQQSAAAVVLVALSAVATAQTLPAPPASPSPVPDWADELSGFVPPAAEEPVSRDGHVGGRVTVTVRPGDEPRQEVIEVVYDGFTDDGEWIIDGTETTRSVDGLLGEATYIADLVVGGDHDGYLRADATFGASGIDGTIESEVDGRHLRLPRLPR